MPAFKFLKEVGFLGALGRKERFFLATDGEELDVHLHQVRDGKLSCLFACIAYDTLCVAPETPMDPLPYR